MIRIENFTKTYANGKTAVKDVSLSCKKGITGLIGLNGAGKSTILKAISALHFPTSGKIYASDANGTFFDSEENPSKVKENVGFVPEANILPKKITVRELLKSSLDFYDVKENARKKNFDFVVDSLSLSEVLDSKIAFLSKGFLQRTLLANAMIFEPENLVLDEAGSGLDPSQIIQFRKTVKKYSETHTVLVSTHIMHEISELSDMIYIMKDGKIAASGSEKELLLKTKTKNLEEAFLFVNGILKDETENNLG